jgi:hypothetical protein
LRSAVVLVAVLVLFPPGADAQDPSTHQHQPAASASNWHVMQDGVAFFTFNEQGGPRGGRDYSLLNWWMGMAERPALGGTVQFNLMLSAEPGTLGKNGYREIFQIGEALDGLPLIDRQHPHEFLMQAAAVYRRPFARGYELAIAGAPVGEPALGPVAFMHRASAFENPTAPLGHHTLDSTHIAMGVLTASLSRGPFQVESSLFNGREPDESRWDLMDPGSLNSWSVRGWYRPNAAWNFQLSHGLLRGPEKLEPGNVRRTTASASWTRGGASTSVIYGRNGKATADYDVFLAESTYGFGANALYGRYEAVQIETDVLRFGTHDTGKLKVSGHVIEDRNRVDTIHALTLGGLRTLSRWSGWDLGAGADVTVYRVPDILQPTHGERPVSFHLFLRLRPPASMGRMVNMTMIGHRQAR